MDGKDYGMVGLQTTDIWDIIQGNCADGSFIWVGDMGVEPPHGT